MTEALPVAAVTNTFAILGQRGTGKTNKATVHVEDMVDAGGHVVILDPVGAWWGATHAGEGPGLPGIVIGGEHGDVPLEETAGTLLAEFVTERHYPVVVIDMKLLRKGAQLRFMADFCETLFHLCREALHVVFEEADRAAPQQIGVKDINASRLLGAVEDIVKLGRSRGLGATLITQRPATLNKNVLEVCENLILFRLMGPNDRKAARAWIEANGDADALKKVLDSLASLGLGEHWFWSPAWLRVLRQEKSRHRRTFDSSGTPEVGQKAAEPTERAPVDLDELRSRMAETIEKAKADDPKALREEIRRLQESVRVLRGREERATPKDSLAAQPCNHGREMALLQEEIKTIRMELADAATDLDAERGRIERLTADLDVAKTSAVRMAAALADERAQFDAGVENLIAHQRTVRRRAEEILLSTNHMIPEVHADASSTRADSAGSEPANRGAQRSAASVPGRDGEPGDRRARGGNTAASRGHVGALPDRPRSGGLAESKGRAAAPRSGGRDTNDMKDEEVEALIDRKLAALGAKVEVVVPPAEVLRQEYQRRAVERVLEKIETLGPDEREAFRFLLSRSGLTSSGDIQKALSGYSGGAAQVKWGTAVKRLAEIGLAETVERQGSKVSAREWVTDELAVHNPTDVELENVYQAVLSRIAVQA